VGRDDLVASAAYQPEPTAAAAARRFVRDTLRSWVVAGDAADGHGLVDDAVLLTSELVTNAVVHAGTPVQVTCKLANGEVEVVVSDAHPTRLVPEPAGNEPAGKEHGAGEHGAGERIGGRGLLLPAALASAWGVTYGRAAKAVWFRLGPIDAAQWRGDVDGGLGEPEAEVTGGTALAAAFGSAGAAAGRSAAVAAAPPDDDDDITAPGHDPGYRRQLWDVAESARAAVDADGSFVLMTDEDGDLRLQATAGSMPPPADIADPADLPDNGSGTAMRGSIPPAPSLLTVPLIVDNRVTGLLSTVAARPGRFADAEAAKLQRLADSCGPRLQRAWLDELERVRRGRISALARTRALLVGRLTQQEIVTLAGIAAVPGLAPWCAVLLPDGDAGLRPAHVRHAEETRTDALTQLLAHVCESEPPAAPPGHGLDAAPAWRWRLPTAAAPTAAAAGTAGEGAWEPAWCFPVGQLPDAEAPIEAGGHDASGHGTGGHDEVGRHSGAGGDKKAAGVLVIGSDRGGRLSREVAALAADLACRIGLALGSVSSVGQQGQDRRARTSG
jgi:anti-sigma regulatory factor (Ser/Thr protein kinase)